MQRTAEQLDVPNHRQSRVINLIAGKVSAKYLAMAIDWGLAIVMVPFNLGHLGKSVYGLWMLVASIPAYFSLFDLGYSAAIVKFAAQYRANGDSRGLNEIASTLFFFFAGIGLSAYAIAVLLAFNIQSLLNLTPEQAITGRQVLLIISIYIAVGFPCSVFGAIVRGFMDPYMTSIISIATSLTVVTVNVVMLLAGYGIVPLVAAITAIRTLSYLAYWRNARRVFPPLRIRASAFRASRLRELTGFSMALLLIDLANKLNYSTDAIVIGAYMSTAAVASWTIAQRPVDLAQRFSNELNLAVFPVVVSSATLGRDDRLRTIFLYGTQLSLAIVIVLAICLILFARPVIALWVGPDFGDSVSVVYVMAFVVMIRIGCVAATTLLEGAGQHRRLAVSTVAAGMANLLLSVLLVRRYGLIGVALGTLIPLGVVSLLVIFPAACRRSGLSVSRAFSTAVAPALWPALPAVALALIARSYGTGSLPAAAAQAVIAVLGYCSIFFGLALGREGRGWYLCNVKQLVRRPGVRAAL
jgi:O-antigen/teichoic acid export membrane protein